MCGSVPWAALRASDAGACSRPRHLPYAAGATGLGRSIGSFRVFARCCWCVEGLVCFGGLGRFGGVFRCCWGCCILSGMVQRSLRERVLSAARENTGLSAARIAEIVGCHPSTVRKYLPARDAAPGGRASRRKQRAQTETGSEHAGSSALHPAAALAAGRAGGQRPLDGFVEDPDENQPNETQPRVAPMPPSERRRRPKAANAGGQRLSRDVPDGLTPDLMFAEIKKILRQNPYAAYELGPFEWCQQWTEINPELRRSERPSRGRHVKQRVPDKAVCSSWYELTVDEINTQWFSGNNRVLVRSSDPLEMAAEVAAAWHAKWPTSTIISEAPASQISALEARYAARGLRVNLVTEDAPRLMQGHVNLAVPEVVSSAVAPDGSLLLQHGIEQPRPAMAAGLCKSAGFTDAQKDLGLSGDVAGNYEFIIDSNAHQFSPSDVEGLDCDEPFDVDVGPGMSGLLEERYHNWRIAGHRAFKALTVDEQAEAVRQDKRQDLYDRALWLRGTPLESEVADILDSLEDKSLEAEEQWRQDALTRSEAEDELSATLP